MDEVETEVSRHGPVLLWRWDMSDVPVVMGMAAVLMLVRLTGLGLTLLHQGPLVLAAFRSALASCRTVRAPEVGGLTR